MKLTVRNWIFGALVPFLGCTAAVLVGSALFRGEMERAVDRALLVQAATEAGSLFDDIGPHLHIAMSQLEPVVRRVTPAAALYDHDGNAILRYPPGHHPITDERLDLDALSEQPRLSTRAGPNGERVRVVSLVVRVPTVPRRGLQIAASLEPVDTSVRLFRKVGLAMALALGGTLFALHGVLARRLSRRVGALSRHMAALREGDLDARPPADAGADEVGELSRLVADATERLRLARGAQERLIAEAAHELRTPLQLMRTSIDLGLRRERERAELKEALADIRGEVDRLARLATRLLDLASAGRGKWDRAPGDLAAVAREAAEGVRAEAETRSVLVEVEAPGPVSASFDANGMRQALDNLLANALQHGPAGGTVRVQVARADGHASVLVHDDGPGIPAEERERVFEPFERGRRRAPGGTGLGLAIVREVARGHGGRAYVAEGEGGNVAIEIPAR